MGGFAAICNWYTGISHEWNLADMNNLPFFFILGIKSRWMHPAKWMCWRRISCLDSIPNGVFLFAPYMTLDKSWHAFGLWLLAPVKSGSLPSQLTLSVPVLALAPPLPGHPTPPQGLIPFPERTKCFRVCMPSHTNCCSHSQYENVFWTEIVEPPP